MKCDENILAPAYCHIPLSAPKNRSLDCPLFLHTQISLCYHLFYGEAKLLWCWWAGELLLSTSYSTTIHFGYLKLSSLKGITLFVVQVSNSASWTRRYLVVIIVHWLYVTVVGAATGMLKFVSLFVSHFGCWMHWMEMSTDNILHVWTRP